MYYVAIKALLKIGSFAHRSYKMRQFFLIGFVMITSYDEYKRREKFKNKHKNSNNDKDLLDII